MPQNDLATVKFLEENGLKGAEIKLLAGDASHRRYARIIKDNQKFILMIAPPEKENIGAFIKVDKILRGAGLNAPEIFARDEKNGLALLEDFGDDLYSRVLADERVDEKELYKAAVKLLDSLPVPGDILPYTQEKMLNESVTFVDWFATDADREGFLDIWKKLIGSVSGWQLWITGRFWLRALPISSNRRAAVLR